MCAALFISLFLSCNNGVIEELQKQKDFILSISNLRQNFLDIFTSFGEMIGGILEFKAETPKSEVGKYFNNIADTIEKVKDKLTSDIANNEHYDKVRTLVDKFIVTLDVIAACTREASKVSKGSEPLGNMPNSATAGNPGEAEKLIKPIKTIVDLVLQEGNPNAGNDKKADDGQTPRANSNDNAGHLFANNNAGAGAANAKKAAADAAKAVGAVTGADILKAISQGEGGAAATLAKNTQNSGSVNAVNSAKDATVAGAIALRAMATGGKFAGQTTADDAIAIVKDAAASAVNKTLSTLIIAIRNTVDSGLKIINKVLAEVKQEDQSSEVTASGTDTK
ncbi:variable large family protein (plasmid) [Borrelia coriaceae]|nr:variable large family protein [Borrelia coriaceae]